MKKTLFIINFLFVLIAFAENRAVMLGHDDKDSRVWLYLSQESKNDDLEIQIKNDDDVNCYITKSELNKILQACKEDKFISFENIYNGNFELENHYKYHYYVSLDEVLDNLVQDVWSDTDDYTPYALNTLYKDDEIGLSKFYFENAAGVLYSKDYNNEDVPIGYYTEDGQVKSCWQYFYGEDVIETYQDEVFYENGEKINLENGILKNIPIKSSLIEIPDIINFTSLIDETTNKISVVVCVCLGGFCCFLVVKNGLKWCRNYLGNSERQEKINNGWYEIEKGRFVPPVSDKIPSVVNDGGVWIDVLHDERYEGNNTIENYIEIRWVHLYDKYVNESSRLVNTNKRVLDFKQFKALAESRKINVSTVDDESFTRQIVDEQLKGSIDSEQKQRRNYKRKYYPRKQYFAIRNYYRRKRTNQTIVTQPVLLPSPVPQQTVVKPDESLTDDEYREKYKSQLDDYIKNKTPENKIYMDALMERHRKAHNISKTQWDNSSSEFARKADEIERTIPIWDDTDTPF